MIHCEKDLLTNLIVLTPRTARRKFRNYIFESWDWKCAYCDEKLKEDTATIDHIIPKFKGGHSTRSNMCCACSNCNRLKGSTSLNDWYTPIYDYYCEKRLVKLKNWMRYESYSLKIPSLEKASSYINHDFYARWIPT